MTDDELYSRFLAGDTASYDELMMRHGDGLVVYINGYLHNWQDAEDLMIDAFARIMVKKPRIRTGNFKAYLYKTARNLSARFYTAENRTKAFSLDSIGEELQDSVLTENILRDKEKKRLLHLCLDRIDPQLKEALWLVYFEDMTYEQAAAVMGVTGKKIDKLLQQGKEQMRKELGKEGITDAY